MKKPRSLDEAIDAFEQAPIAGDAKAIARRQLKALVDEMLTEAREKGRELEREDWNGAER